MSVFAQTVPSAASGATRLENRLNSQFKHIHKNKSVKAHGVVEEKSVIIQDESRYLDKY